MKFLLVLLAAAAIWYFGFRKPPVAPAKHPSAQRTAPGITPVATPGVYKRSVDKANAFSGKMTDRVGNGEY